MKPVTLGLIIGNRGFFPAELCEEWRVAILDVLAKAGFEVVALNPKATKHGRQHRKPQRCEEMRRARIRVPFGRESCKGSNFTVAEIVIRSYEPRDRAAVRHICCETADAGGPVEGFFHDRELIADLVTRYYTDFEPQHSWVAVRDGRVVGYLNGTLSGRRALRITLWRVVPVSVTGALLRGALCRRETWRLLCAWSRTLWDRRLYCGGTSGTGVAPHLHVNLLSEARGVKVGPRLVERFLDQVKASGGKTVEAHVRRDNLVACHFFKQLGFSEVACQGLVLSTPTGYRETDAVTYAKRW